MNTRFSLRRMLLAVAAVGCLLAIYELHARNVIALRIFTDSSAEPVYVYLDNRPLGITPLTISAAEARKLGIGPVGHWSRFTSNTFGVFLLDYKRGDGSVPHINFRRSNVGKSSPSEAMRRNEIVPAKLILAAGHDFELTPRRTIDAIRGEFVNDVQAGNGQIAVALKIPSELRDNALKFHGGLLISMTAVSSVDGYERHKSFKLRSVGDFALMDYTISWPAPYPPESMMIIVSFQGCDEKPVRDWEAANEGFILSCADKRWSKTALKPRRSGTVLRP